MGAKLLVVHPSPEFRRELRDLLAGQGVSILDAANMHGALDQVGDQPIDGVICAVDLQGPDGLSLTRVLQSRVTTRQTPVILLYSVDDDHRETEAQALGVRGWFRLPEQAPALKALVDRLLL